MSRLHEVVKSKAPVHQLLCLELIRYRFLKHLVQADTGLMEVCCKNRECVVDRHQFVPIRTSQSLEGQKNKLRSRRAIAWLSEALHLNNMLCLTPTDRNPSVNVCLVLHMHHSIANLDVVVFAELHIVLVGSLNIEPL